MLIPRSAEAEAFPATLDATAPELVTACDGWTTHEVAAHVAGTSGVVDLAAVRDADHLDDHLVVDPEFWPPSRSQRMPLRANPWTK